MFKAGVLTDGELTISDEGVPQGSPCSPVLANIFAHYVIDEWFENIVKAHCRGQVEMFRYCDDFVICCQYDYDTERIMRVLGKRLAKFGLKLNNDLMSVQTDDQIIEIGSGTGKLIKKWH